MSGARVVVVGAGIGGLTAAALLAQEGFRVTVLEAQAYAGGSAGTFFHKGYRFEAGATVAGGFQPNGPHHLVAQRLNMSWRVHEHDPAWVVHLPGREIRLTKDNHDVLNNFPNSEFFWREQSALADLGWSLSAQGLPWPPTSRAEWLKLLETGIRNLPGDLRLAPFAFMTTYQWLKLRRLASDREFVRFIDGQLLISAQTTSRGANAVYSATALDLARQGVFHVEGGIGGLADQLVDQIRGLGGEVRFKQRAVRIRIENGSAVGVETTRFRKPEFFPADFVIANVTPWSLDSLLADHSPKRLKQEVAERKPGWGAFALHLGVRADALPHELPDHHQVIADLDSPLGEGKSVFVSMSPTWDTSRAPAGHRAVTVTTHTDVRQWWNLLAEDKTKYGDRKAAYTEMMIAAVDSVIPGFRRSLALVLPGTPVTYEFYTGRHLGMVGGFPQTSLFRARSPLTGIGNVRLVGDSIFPGQSTAGVSLGAIRVFEDVRRRLPKPAHKSVYSPPKREADDTAEITPERELETA